MKITLQLIVFPPHQHYVILVAYIIFRIGLDLCGSEVHIIDPNMPEWGDGKAWLYFRLDENNEFSPWTNKDYEYKEIYTEKLKRNILDQLSVILEDDEEVFNNEMLEKN
jgi:uncharacterized membrane protein